MEQLPLVSVIVVSYNHAKFIKENLDSIRNQSYSKIELILADDASSDESVAVFERWLTDNEMSAKKNFHIQNTGLATTLNECIELATGKYIKLLAADDFLDPFYIEKCVDVFCRTNCSAVFTNAYGVDETSKIITNKFFNVPKFENYKEFVSMLLSGNFISGAVLIMRKNVFNDFGRYSKDTLLEDYNFVLALIKKQHIIEYIEESLIYYRRHASNITVLKTFLLDAETIKEKIKFDSNGEFAYIINKDINLQIQKLNPELKRIIPLYKMYKGKSLKIYLKLKYPDLHKLLSKCFH